MRPRERALRPEASALNQVEEQLAALCATFRVSERAAGEARQLLRIFSADALHRPANEFYRGLSSINAKGFPLQWSFCIDGRPSSVRFLCEAGRIGSSAARRHRVSLHRLRRAADLLSLPPLGWLWDAIDLAVPSTEPVPEHWRSTLWFGVGARADSVALKVYLNFERDRAYDRWWRFGHLLKSLGRHSALAEVCRISAEVSRDSWPVGLCLDVRPDGSAGKVKLYLYSDEVGPDWLRRWYRSLGRQEWAERVLSTAWSCAPVESHRFPERSFYISLEVHEDESLSLKTDIPLSRSAKSDWAVVDVVRALARDLGVSEVAYLEGLHALGAFPPDARSRGVHELIGIGVEPDGTGHINLYCHPRIQ
jgi:hypothetical protein